MSPYQLAALCVATAGALVVGCSSTSPPAALLTSSALMDPTTCQGCHPTQFAQWAGSMHAYASEDPVFLAMNKRGQRETNDALGTFCVQCHAPVAVQQKLTTDGLNLATLPAATKGVTCYFCHSTASVAGTHNDPLMLAADGESLFGPFADPVPGSPHKVSHSNLLDDSMAESAAACGSCHDIVNQEGTAIERTYHEWQGTLFAVPPHGQTCAACHMPGRDGPVATTTTKVRRLHDHSLPGTDVALTSFPGADVQKQAIQALIDPALLTSVCYSPTTRTIEVQLDNAGAGHGFPSGASQDRRVWVEVTAYAGTQILYQSGVPAAGQTVESAPDPDLWMIRDCMFGDTGKSVDMFWQAASYMTNELPGSVTLSVTDPSTYTRSHIKSVYPGGGASLSQAPDRIDVKVHMTPIGEDVLQDLVASGDLDASFLSAEPTFTPASGTIEWTPSAAPVVGSEPPIYCVVGGNNPYVATPNVAKSNARCGSSSAPNADAAAQDADASARDADVEDGAVGDEADAGVD
jgi:hypothetical protein